MPRYAANLSMLWQEHHDPLARFELAAHAGFRRVEMLFPHQLDTDRVVEALADNELEMVLFDPHPGDWAAGERGLLALPGREQECLETIHAAVELAGRLHAPRLNCLAGLIPEGADPEDCLDVAGDNLRRAAPLVREAGVALLVEPINTVDMPGYAVDTLEKAAALVESVDDPSVRLQLDQYHVAMAGGDAIDGLRRYFGLVDHVQIADVPGRGQPGTGEQPIPSFLEELDHLGYTGVVGLEYKPQGTTGESLAWLPIAARA
ncbi:MAG: TIM barrel protein [Candidatus Dormibacteraeota bacterium]|nr:TIM barrel protein [Candidatus Dormibacteraeota bacterium]